MKYFILLLALIVSCSNDNNRKELDKPKGYLEVIKTDEDCKPLDILILKEKNIKTLFFQKLNSTVNKQYLGKKKESVDLNQELVESFLNDLDTKIFQENLIFKKKYKTKLKTEYAQSKNESNTIELRYFKEDCFYRISVLNYYETDEYSDESSVIYFFKIENKQITNFGRQEAG